MYLKALEIQGFKSFPDKTILSFEKDITAIVGPNGCGKSNISDALLWVMGEQRSKALRGGKMEDVIFGGTEKRSPMGFAQVTLVLDNSGGLFDLDAPEVSISRRYYRTGESEYFLNRESVRLKDVTSLLMDTGLGRDGYSIIGQGRIAEIVSAKSTDRREIFEEAAGISRFRYRKEEAERKLDRTEDNLLRINDKIEELELQVGPLQKQAETAKKYLVLRDEQRALEISVWMTALDRLQEQSEGLKADFEQAQADLAAAQTELEQIYASADEFASGIRDYDVKGEQLRSTQAEREAAAAEQDAAAAVLQADLKHNEENIQRLREELHAQADRTEQLRQQVEEQQKRIAQIGVLLAENTLKVRDVQAETERSAAEADEAQRGLAALVAGENELGDALTKCTTMRSMLRDKAEELQQRGGSIGVELEESQRKYQEISEQLHTARRQRDAAQERVNEINNVISGHKLLLGSREEKVRGLTEQSNALLVERRSAESRVQLLSDMEKEYEGMGKAVRNVMQAAQRGTLRGVHGPVAGLLSVEDRFTVAIETALGAAMNHIVVDSQACGKAAVELLHRTDGGRATFLPIDITRPAYLQKAPVKEAGYLGIASDLVRCEAQYTDIFRHLLGRTVVAESLTDATRMSKNNGYQLRIVTLDGQMVNPGGSLTGGSAARNVGILSRANELKRLQARVAELTEQGKACQAQLAEAERILSGARYEAEVAAQELTGAAEALHKAETAVSQYQLMQTTLDEALESLEQERSSLTASIRETQERISAAETEQGSLENQLAALRSKIAAATEGQGDFELRRAALTEQMSALRANAASLEAERETANRSVESLHSLLDTLTGDSSQRTDSIALLQQQGAALQDRWQQTVAQAALLRQQASDLKTQIAALSTAKMELEGRRTKNDRLGQEKNRELLDLQSNCARLEQKKLSAEMEEKQLVDKLWDSYELSRTAAQALRQPVENLNAANKRVTELRREIGRLGNVNIGAIDEFARVSERYNFLKGQRDDVETAKRDLLKIISDITGEMKEIFVREFHNIDERFRSVFLELFGGGKASLVLEDPEEPLTCGIEIKVQPPGKAVTTISLLSGGEKSFVAIALYFAIMKVRPTPFCVMDEIDAALDEANVERYAQYMRGMAGETQFIVITHHRATMEEADVLYGVTMQEKGVTSVLNIDLDEAERSIS